MADEQQGSSSDLEILNTASEEDQSEDLESKLSEGLEEEEEEVKVDEEKVEEKEEELTEDEKVLEGEEGEEKTPEDYIMAERPLKGLKEKYPKVFKDFPALKQAWYGAREFYGLFSSVNAAKEVIERSQALADVEKDIFENASSKELLTRIKDGNPEVFKEFTGTLLENIQEIDNNLLDNCL